MGYLYLFCISEVTQRQKRCPFSCRRNSPVGDVGITQLDWKRVPQARSLQRFCRHNCRVFVAPRKSKRQLTADSVRRHSTRLRAWSSSSPLTTLAVPRTRRPLPLSVTEVLLSQDRVCADRLLAVDNLDDPTAVHCGIRFFAQYKYAYYALTGRPTCAAH